MPAEVAAFFVHSPVFDVGYPRGRQGDTRVPAPPTPPGVAVVATYPDKDVLMSGWLLGERYLHNRAAVVDASVEQGPRRPARHSGHSTGASRTARSSCCSTRFIWAEPSRSGVHVGRPLTGSAQSGHEAGPGRLERPASRVLGRRRPLPGTLSSPAASKL